MRSWMNITTGTRTALRRNGIRQPQSTNCSWLTSAPTIRNTPLPRITPIGTPICANEPVKPLRSVPELSVSRSVTQRHEQDRCGRTDRVSGGQHADDEGGRPHHQEAGHERGLAADLVAEVTEHHAAERSRDEARPEGAERQQ